MSFGTLYLIPTPIDEQNMLNVEAFELLNKYALDENSIIVVEDLKPARKRWIHFKLPREAIERFRQLNEHNTQNSSLELITELKNGKNVFIMSDGGLPAFCDPGKDLVYQCHKNRIKVTATPFFNSVILALALSGLDHDEFYFQGFLPKDSDDRKKVIEKLASTKITTIVMDTPYRLKRLLEEILECKSFTKEIFLALDLNSSTEELYLGTADKILKTVTDFKREFILIVGPHKKA